MNRCRIFLFSLVVLALVIAGCSSQTGSSPVTSRPSDRPQPVTSPVPPATPLQPFRGDWSLASMASHGGTFPSIPATAISLSINATAGSLSGYSGCNNYYAPYTLTGTVTSFGNSISIGPVTSTKKYCQETSSYESTYLAILGDATAFAGDNTHLTFTDSENNKLVFKRLSA